MYIVIENEKEIEKYQNKFLDILREGAKVFKNVNIGHQGGNKRLSVYWLPDKGLPDKGLWSSSYKKTEKGNRYVNWFGLTNPKGNTKLSINGEICISIQGSRSAGKFVKDDKNTIFIAHNGDFRIGGKRIKDSFLEHCEREENWKIIQTDKEKLVLIDELTSDEAKYSDFQRKIRIFIKEADKIKNNANEEADDLNTKKEFEQNKLNQQSISNDDIKKNESSYKIAQSVREIILSINEICKLQKKKGIFDEAVLFRLWGNIEKTCESKIDFKGFAENLYKLLIEATRDKNPNKKNKNDQHYLFRMPIIFIKKEPTKHFWDIVNTLRHYFDHVNDKNNIKNIADVYKEFLGNSSGPESPEDFSKLQIEVLNLFEKSMNILLKMIKNEK